LTNLTEREGVNVMPEPCLAGGRCWRKDPSEASSPSNILPRDSIRKKARPRRPDRETQGHSLLADKHVFGYHAENRL